MADLDLLQEQAIRKGLAEKPEALEVYEKETPRISATLASSMIPSDPYGTYEAYKKGGIEEAAKNLGMNLLFHAIGMGVGAGVGKGVQLYQGAKEAKAVANLAKATAAEELAATRAATKAKVLADPAVQARLQRAAQLKEELKIAEGAKDLEKRIADNERLAKIFDDEIAETRNATKGEGLYREWEPAEIEDQLNRLTTEREAIETELNLLRGNRVKTKPKVFERNEPSKLATKEGKVASSALQQYEDITNDIREIENIVDNLEKTGTNPQVQQSLKEAYDRRESLLRELGRLENKFPSLGSGGKVNAVVPPMFLPLVLGQSNNKKKK